MDVLEESAHLMSMASLILLVILNSNRNVCSLEESFLEGQHGFNVANAFSVEGSSRMPVNVAARAKLQHFRLFSTLASIDEDLGFWVKPQSTAWFTRFLLHEYDDDRWLQMFRMTKRSVLNLAQVLAPALKKKDTKYRAAVLVTVRLACTLFKLSHGPTLLIYSELFAIGRSTISCILRQVVHAINDGLRNEIQWPFGEAIQETAEGFRNLCGLPGILGAVGGTHFSIGKPRCGAADYFYFKSGSYTVNCQAVVDSSKKNLDLYVGMPGSTNDARMLRRSTLYNRGQRNSLWEGNPTFVGFTPSLLGDSGYPLLPWLMVPHRRGPQLPVADAVFNRRLSRGRAVVENAFALLKLTFRELHQKTELHVAFVPDVVMCCAILHNVLLNQSNEEIDHLMAVLQREGPEPQPAPPATVADVLEEVVDGDRADDEDAASVKRRDLGLFITAQ